MRPIQQSLLDHFERVKASWASAKDQPVTMQTVCMVLCVISLLILIKPVEPPDDLLRHLISYLHGYDYRGMYAYSLYPSFNMYIGFDFLVGHVHQIVGHYAFVIVQIANLLLFSAAFLYLLRGTEPNLRLMLLLVALYVIYERMLMGRPSFFMSSLMMIGIGLSRDERAKWWHHAILGCSMAPLYYLFPIYLIPMVLYSRVYLIVLVAGLAGWHFCTDGAYWQTAYSVLSSGSVGRFTQISELGSIWGFLLVFSFALVPALLYFKKDKKVVLTIIWFLLPNQLRYIESAFPLLVSVGRHMRFRPPMYALLALFFFLCLKTSAAWVEAAPKSSLYLRDRLPAHSRVLTLEMLPKALYVNNGIILAPGFEPEWMDRELRGFWSTANKTGKLDCRVFEKYSFDYIVDPGLLIEKPACLDLVDVAGIYRIWKPKQTASKK